MGKKYELTDETIEFDGYITLYRIHELRDFRDEKAGNLDSFIEDEDSLSHENDCWIYNDAKAYSFTNIYDSAKIFDNAQVAYNAQIFGNAKIYDNSEACNKTMTAQNGVPSTKDNIPF
ncbi:hypothetical protein [Bartonella sp. AP7XZML]|uniref:hypothetical protein n=1 Tax=Bartonella sp. AP7XZML TaxID=3243503 RepID=UPI0035D0FB4C